MRLIDGDALIKRLDYCVSQGLGGNIAYMFKDMVDEAPTVDAVPVIRCKDCKYRDEQSANCTRFRKDWYVQGNSFCSWAERKEE